jgi:hypothetical protein
MKRMFLHILISYEENIYNIKVSKLVECGVLNSLEGALAIQKPTEA